MAKSRRTRTSKVIVPKEFEIPEGAVLELPGPQGDLDDPHEYFGPAVYSYRRHARSHHRVVIRAPETKGWKFVNVEIPIREYDFEPFQSQWRHFGRCYMLLHHKGPQLDVYILRPIVTGKRITTR